MPTGNNLSPAELVDRIGKILISKSETVSVAESVTSGDLQFQFSQAESARKFFEGGITTYTITQKTKHLQVDPVHALAANCVSEIVSCEMSMNVSKMFMTDWGIGITGYAAPVPEKGIKDTFAYYSIHYKNEEVAKGKIDVEKNSPSDTQRHFSTQVLSAFLKLLKK